MTGYDGHEVAIITTFVGGVALIDRAMPKGWVRGFIHRQPVAAMACFWAITGMTLPLIIPPIRRALKFPTNQYDATHPNALSPKY